MTMTIQEKRARLRVLLDEVEDIIDTIPQVDDDSEDIDEIILTLTETKLNDIIETINNKLDY